MEIVKIIVNIELIINLILLLLFYMHMFQLNSYFSKRYMNWIKKNSKKVVLKSCGVLIPFIMLLFNNNVANIISVIFLAISIFFNIPKGKSKIPLKFTPRVNRMFITQFLFILL